MDRDTNEETTPHRRLEFCSQEVNTEKEFLDNSSGENISTVHQSIILGEKIPKIDMEFDSEEATYRFYNEYAKLIGFSIRKHTVHKDITGKIIDRTFVCACQGHRPKDKRDYTIKSHRPETRKGCCAMMKIDVCYTGKYKVVNFVADHNGHDLVSPSKTHFLRSHRAITAAQALQADDIDSSGITPKAVFALMAKQVDGRA